MISYFSVGKFNNLYGSFRFFFSEVKEQYLWITKRENFVGKILYEFESTGWPNLFYNFYLYYHIQLQRFLHDQNTYNAFSRVLFKAFVRS